MKLRLIALPWTDISYPQPALGALTAYLAQKEPRWQVETLYSYLDVAAAEQELYKAIAASDIEGERLYATLLYPEGTERLVAYWELLNRRTQLGEQLALLKRRGQRVADVVARLRQRLDKHLDALIAAHDWNDTVVGMTTSFSQLFANVLFAKRLKATGQSVTVILGGSTVSPAAISDSVLKTYPWIDYIVRGEGELPLHALLKRIERAQHGITEQAAESGEPPGQEEPLRGVVSRQHPGYTGSLWQVEDLDTLPIPDFDQFFRIAPQHGQGALPIEGSRGCWWDRTTKNPKATCNFCNLNVQWDGFRQKSARRVLAEMRELARRYRCVDFAFLDNIVRTRGYDEFIDALSELEMDARIFHEARSNLRPGDILRFREVGLRAVQFGLEGLSGTFLKRINKGTSVIMNLEVMKTCAELRIRSASNLIMDFPGSTQEDVDETLRVIDRYAYAYEPPALAGFELGIDSVVARFPENFGLTRVRNHDRYAEVVPPEHMATLRMFQLSFDLEKPGVDWMPVIERVEQWKQDYKPHPMWYQDGGTFIHVFKNRPGRSIESIELDGDAAQAYRFCLQIRTQSELNELFGTSPEFQAKIQKMLDQNIMYHEGERYLALAAAPDPTVAAKRIRAQVPKRPRRLAVAK